MYRQKSIAAAVWISKKNMDANERDVHPKSTLVRKLRKNTVPPLQLGIPYTKHRFP